jgi:hypothetical protein
VHKGGSDLLRSPIPRPAIQNLPPALAAVALTKISVVQKLLHGCCKLFQISLD